MEAINPEWYGLFSPAIDDDEEEEKKIGIPPNIKYFSHQLRFLNQTLFLPHKQTGEKSEFLTDQIFVCKVNSCDEIHVAERVVLFPNNSSRFPLLMSEKLAKKKILAILEGVITDEGNNGEEDILELFDIDDKADILGMFLSLLVLCFKLNSLFKDKIKGWFLQNQDKLSTEMTNKINKIIEETPENNSSGGEEYDRLMVRYLLTTLSNLYEILHLKPIGVVTCLIETPMNYATYGDFIQVKLNLC